MTKRLKFIPSLADMIKKGEKNTTFRIFDDKDLQVDDDLILVNSETGDVFGYAKITEIHEKPLNALQESDWVGHEPLEGEESLIDLMRRLYKVPIDDTEKVKIVRFDLV
jgi:hypothetical protein